MKAPSRVLDPIRPAVPQVKWWIVVTIFVLLGVWQWVVHRWLMYLPMATSHVLSALLGAGIVILAVLGLLALIQRYEDRLVAGSKILWDLDQELRKNVAQRNTGLLEVARELEQLGIEVRQDCEEAQREPTADHLAGVLSALRNRSDAMMRLGCAINRLVEETDISIKLAHAMEDYRCHCTAGAEAASTPHVTAQVGSAK